MMPVWGRGKEGPSGRVPESLEDRTSVRSQPGKHRVSGQEAGPVKGIGEWTDRQSRQLFGKTDRKTDQNSQS